MTIILALQGYVVALLALYAAFAPRRRRGHRFMRPALCAVSFVAAAASTLAMAKVGGAGAVHFVSLVISFIAAAASIGWLFVSTIGSFEQPRRQTRPANVDFSFLHATPQGDNPGATESAPTPCPKLNPRRWVERLKRIKFLNRWSYMSDSP